MRHKLPGELRDEREIFMQAPAERRGGLVVAGIDGGEEEPEQRTADRLQGLAHTGAFLKQDAPRIAPRAATAWWRARRAFRRSGASARAAKLHPARRRSAPPRPASKARWQSRDQSAGAPDDCRSCSAARRSASSGNSQEIVAALRGARAAMPANSLRCLSARRERKQKNLNHQNPLKK